MPSPTMIDIFAVLAVIGRYHELVQTETAAAPELEQFYNEIQAWLGKHPKLIADLPEVQQAYFELQALIASHKDLIAQQQALTPQLQALVNELLPLLQPTWGTQDGTH